MSARAHDGCWCRTQRFEDQPSSSRVTAKLARTAPSLDGVAEWGDPLLVALYGVDALDGYPSLDDDGICRCCCCTGTCNGYPEDEWQLPWLVAMPRRYPNVRVSPRLTRA